jgi:hypothetical protein
MSGDTAPASRIRLRSLFAPGFAASSLLSRPTHRDPADAPDTIRSVDVAPGIASPGATWLVRYVHVSPTVFGAYPGNCTDASADAPGSQVTSTSAPTITSRHELPTSTSTSLG